MHAPEPAGAVMHLASMLVVSAACCRLHSCSALYMLLLCSAHDINISRVGVNGQAAQAEIARAREPLTSARWSEPPPASSDSRFLTSDAARRAPGSTGRTHGLLQPVAPPSQCQRTKATDQDAATRGVTNYHEAGTLLVRCRRQFAHTDILL